MVGKPFLTLQYEKIGGRFSQNPVTERIFRPLVKTSTEKKFGSKPGLKEKGQLLFVKTLPFLKA
jgi:hypothetical protein